MDVPVGRIELSWLSMRGVELKRVDVLDGSPLFDWRSNGGYDAVDYSAYYFIDS